MSLFDESFQKKMEYLYVVSKRVFGGRMRENRRVRKVLSGMEFADHRNYAPGDDVRSLDWRVYGRTEKLLIRLFEEKEELYIYFLIDVSKSMYGRDKSKLDYAKQMAAALGYIGLCNQNRVGFASFSDGIKSSMPPMQGRGRIFQVFDFLDKLEMGVETSLEDSFRDFAARNRHRGVVVILSDFYNPNGFENALNYLHYRRFETYVIHAVDDRDLEFSDYGDVSLLDEETGEVCDVTMTPALIEKYLEAFDDMCTQMESYCDSHGMLYFRVPVDEPFENIVLKVFRAGGFVK